MPIIWLAQPSRIMNRIARLLSPSKIVLDLTPSSKKRVFEQVSLLFENEHGLERAKTFDSLFQRERLGSTGLGNGVAIPHGRIKGLKETRACLVRLVQPIAFEAPDEEPVKLLIFMLVPENASEEHLELLSELAEMLTDDKIHDGLMQLETAGAILSLLQSWDPMQSAN